MEKKYYGLLQSLEVVQPDQPYDIEVFGQYYKLPGSGVSPMISSGSTEYKYDFGKKEIILFSVEGKEIYRKQVEPKVFAKSEYKWLKLAREEARLSLGLDEVY